MLSRRFVEPIASEDKRSSPFSLSPLLIYSSSMNQSYPAFVLSMHNNAL